MPTKIKVGPLVYDVIMDSDRIPEEHEGRLESWMTRILLRGDRPDAYTRATLVHEVIHACMVSSGVPRDQKRVEEDFVRALEIPLLQVLRDNLDLVKWLTVEEK